ncbi:hypothetical protein ASPCADRAFT_210901 [Aspergillus carbonarius ITEM 5010]|uniref:Uncharacterized protein n=1 Tax=Aspergillus carbonarius (strain ITEM 5010) TaxID=602072 RepID=A0A1R3RAL8_ASPC5|nr:hypothetical protein ASPCADRAFT_210901 [Aspergillus carbonarius ITEM 5010]
MATEVPGRVSNRVNWGLPPLPSLSLPPSCGVSDCFHTWSEKECGVYREFLKLHRTP